MFCTNCGVQRVSDTAPFCTHCGAPAIKAPAQISVQANGGAPALVDQPPAAPVAEQIALCPFCKEEIRIGAIKCKHCNSILNTQDGPSTPGVIEALKSTNTCLLWVSLDYWNLYASGDRLILARCYRGKWGLIGFVLGLFVYVIASVIIGGLGVLLDRQNGTSRCRLMKDKLQDVLRSPGQYHVLEVRRSESIVIDGSDLCLGNLWLKYMIRVKGQKFYCEESQYEQVRALCGQQLHA